MAEEIISYVLRDMTSTEGGFLSAEDADSEGIELNQHMLSRSWDEQNGGLYMTADDSEKLKDITAFAPYTLSMRAKNGQATAYVCQEFACKLPTASIDQMLENLRQ